MVFVAATPFWDRVTSSHRHSVNKKGWLCAKKKLNLSNLHMSQALFIFS